MYKILIQEIMDSSTHANIITHTDRIRFFIEDI